MYVGAHGFEMRGSKIYIWFSDLIYGQNLTYQPTERWTDRVIGKLHFQNWHAVSLKGNKVSWYGVHTLTNQKYLKMFSPGAYRAFC